MADYGMKISEAGADVLTADLVNLNFQSEKVILKIFAEGEITVTINNGDNQGYTDVTHNLGYKPFYLGYVILGGKSRDAGFSGIALTEDTDFTDFGGRGTTTRVRYFVSRTSTTGTVNYTVYYYILVNSMETG